MYSPQFNWRISFQILGVKGYIVGSSRVCCRFVFILFFFLGMILFCCFHIYAVVQFYPCFKALSHIACVAGVQRGGGREVECEREARSLAYKGEGGEKLNATTIALRARIQLPPPSPLYAGHAVYITHYHTPKTIENNILN